VLSDTMGVDFGPFLRGVLHDVKMKWYQLIPSAAVTKKGRVSIEFAVLKNGSIRGMRFAQTSGDAEMDRAAWSGIISSAPFPALPSEFPGQYLALSFHFYYNPDNCDSPGGASPTKTVAKSSITVSIVESDGLTVPVGTKQVIIATTKGTANTAVRWCVTGAGCYGLTCGTMQGDFYTAPDVLPSPPSIRLTATSEADSAASASITVHLVAAKSPAK
jgi:TonB family protein